MKEQLTPIPSIFIQNMETLETLFLESKQIINWDAEWLFIDLFLDALLNGWDFCHVHALNTLITGHFADSLFKKTSEALVASLASSEESSIVLH